MGCERCGRREQLVGDQIPISVRYVHEPWENRLAGPVIKRDGRAAIRARHPFLADVDVLLSARLCPCDASRLRLLTYAPDEGGYRFQVSCADCGSSTNRVCHTPEDPTNLSSRVYWMDGTDQDESDPEPNDGGSGGTLLSLTKRHK